MVNFFEILLCHGKGIIVDRVHTRRHVDKKHFENYIYLLSVMYYLLSVCAHAHKPRGAREGQRTNCGSCFSPPTRELSSNW